jgi:diguanylate cyclase (GGDEF)-like protein/PAS domain S-box-containing protein
MIMVFNSIAIFVLFCGVMTAALGIYAWQFRSTIGTRSFAIFMLLMAVYVVGYSLELASTEIDSMLFWNKLQYIGALLFPTTYLIFTIQFTDHGSWLSREKMLLLYLIPFMFLGVKFFDGQLRLIYAAAEIDRSGWIPMLSFTRGPLYYGHTIYALLTIALGNYLILQKRQSGSNLFRRQTNCILMTALFIYLVYAVYLSGITLVPGLPHLDLNPPVYSLWGLAVTIAIFRHGLFNLAPIARDTLIENLNDGVLVLDEQHRLVDANPQAQVIFNWSEPPLGKFAHSFTHNWLDPAALAALEGPACFEKQLEVGGATLHYELTITPLREKQRQMLGYLVVIHDITRRIAIEKKLQELSLIDELTGLTNRRGFNMLATQLINMVYRMQRDAVLVYMDMDGFKWINDNLGHAAGDQALIDTGVLLKKAFRAADIIARYGGDEFLIFAIESDDISGETMLARLQEQLDAYNARSNLKHPLSISAGMARYHWQQPASLETLMEQADRAMYVVKQNKKKACQDVPTRPRGKTNQ